MITPICKSCFINEGSVFAVFKSSASVWANSPTEWVLIYCDDCWSEYECRAGPIKHSLNTRLYITKEDYLAALAMVEL